MGGILGYFQSVVVLVLGFGFSEWFCGFVVVVVDEDVLLGVVALRSWIRKNQGENGTGCFDVEGAREANRWGMITHGGMGFLRCA